MRRLEKNECLVLVVFDLWDFQAINLREANVMYMDNNNVHAVNVVNIVVDNLTVRTMKMVDVDKIIERIDTKSVGVDNIVNTVNVVIDDIIYVTIIMRVGVVDNIDVCVVKQQRT